MKNKTWLFTVIIVMVLLDMGYLLWLHQIGETKWIHLLRVGLMSGVLLLLAWSLRQWTDVTLPPVQLSGMEQDLNRHRLFTLRKAANGDIMTDLPGGELSRSIEQSGKSVDSGGLRYFYDQVVSGKSVRFQMESGDNVWHITLSPLVDSNGLVSRVIGSAVDFGGNHDNLTGLPNRKMLEKQIRRWTESKGRHPLAVMFIDLDRFKTINDTAGHQVGDRLLVEVTARLKGDLDHRMLIARQGGDEFSVTVPVAKREQAARIAEELLQRLSRPYVVEGKEYLLTASIGISLYPYDAHNMEQLFKNADAAMYLAKERGNCYHFYSKSINETLSWELEMEAGLRKALENDEFHLYYQPQFDLTTGSMIGMEALIRWVHPTKGVISPGEFIPIAEETGWIVPIGEWVLRTACRQNSEWQKAGFRPVPVAVNISAIQFQHPQFFENVFQILEETGLDPRYLELEMTESIFQNADTVITGMNRLKQIGVQLSIDDFGTGYSSLSYLKRFPVDSLKIDQSFVGDFMQQANGAALVKAIIALARSMKLRVVAEGIETEEQRRFLELEQCHGGQGYLFAPPLPADQFRRWLIIHTQEKETGRLV